MSDFLKSLGDFLEKIDNKMREKDVPENDGPPEILTADKLQKLKWMSPRQLAAIYRYGKRKVKLTDDPDAYGQLKWFSEGQLEAIFGKEED